MGKLLREIGRLFIIENEPLAHIPSVPNAAVNGISDDWKNVRGDAACAAEKLIRGQKRNGKT